MSYLTDSVLY